MSFSPFQSGFLDLLKHGGPSDEGLLSGEEWFKTAIFRTYQEIARLNGCEMQPSARRLREARELWLNELSNMKITGGGEPDHFKQAGFLTYWLRRRLVISITREGANFTGSSQQIQFLERPNEICSFILGFRICLFFQANRKSGEERRQYLSSIELQSEFVKDAGILLYEKQLSPHAMYLIYRSLFYELKPPPGEVVPLRLVHSGPTD
jgi:hypothetical protein